MKKAFIIIGLFFVSVFCASQDRPIDTVKIIVDKADLTKKFPAELRNIFETERAKNKEGHYSEKASSQLNELYYALLSQNITQQDFYQFRIKERLDVNIGGGVELDSMGIFRGIIRSSSLNSYEDSSLVSQLRDLGILITGVVQGYGGLVIGGLIPITKLHEVCRIDRIRNVRAFVKASTNYGAYTTQGDKLINADKTRTLFYLRKDDTPSISVFPKVGVISDGAYNYLNSTNSQDLDISKFSVDLFNYGASGENEGTALAEIIYDIAPKTNIVFRPSNYYTNGVATEYNFRNLVNNLSTTQACDVIVDDITIFDEPMFADGVVANSIKNNNVTNNVAYISSAGNFAKTTWYGSMDPYILGSANRKIHTFNFSDGLAGHFNRVTIPAGKKVKAYLQWTDLWYNAPSNYDLFLYSGQSVDAGQLAASTIVQSSSSYQIPYESIEYTNTSGSEMTAYLVIERKGTGGSNVSTRLVVDPNAGVSSIQYTQNGAYSVFGHTSSKYCISTGAVGHDKTFRDFSSSGPAYIDIYTDENFTTISTFDESREVPTMLGVDGVDTYIGKSNTWPPGYNGFIGTSAAAPHVAGVTSLMLSVNPDLTPSQIKTILAKSATKVNSSLYGYNTNGTEGTTRNNLFGYGLVDAYKAVRDALPIQDNQSYSSNAEVKYKHLKGSTYIASNIEVTVPANSTVYLEGSLLGGNTSSKISVYGTLIIAEGFVQNTAEIDGRNGTVIFEKDLNMTNNACFIVRSGGTLSIPTDGSMIANNGAFIVWSNGSTIEIGDGANVQVNYYNSTSRLQIAYGATIKLGSNANIISYAPILTSGTSQPITFTSLSGSTTSGSWGSIILNGSGAASSNLNYITMQYGTDIQFLNGANAILQNSTIRNCLRGVYIYNAMPQIVNNLIDEVYQDGIYCSGSGSVFAEDNIIQKTFDSENEGNYGGIKVNNDIYGSFTAHNDIKGFVVGIWVDGIGVCKLDNQWYDYYSVNNRVTNCLYGTAATYGAYLFMQDDDDSNAHNNSIHDNMYYDLSAWDQSIILNSYNYFGGGNPSSYTTAGGLIYSSYPLTTDPWGGSLLKESSPAIFATNETLPDDIAEFKNGLAFIHRKEYANARNYFKQKIQSGKISRNMLTGLAHAGIQDGNSEALSYFETLKNSDSEYKAQAMHLLTGLYMRVKEYKKVELLHDEIMTTFPNTRSERDALFQKFYLTLHVEGNKVKAQNLLNTIASKYSSDGDKADIARAQSIFNSGIASPQEGKEPTKETIKSKNEFILSQNSPNPFNPTTTIKYSIVEPANVELKVFDYLGREVTTLVSDYKDKGTYSINFNANNLASGIYFYRITAGKNVSIKKMLLLK